MSTVKRNDSHPHRHGPSIARWWIFRVCIVVALAVLVNIAVAWGCSVWGIETRFEGKRASDTVNEMHDERVPDHLQGNFDDVIVERGLGFGICCEIWQAIMLKNPAMTRRLYRCTSGWPLRCMRWSEQHLRIHDRIGRRWTWANGVHAGVGTPTTFQTLPPLERRLPLQPIMPAFALGTLMWMLPIGLLWLCPGLLRRHLRRKRNRCPACGYPIGASPVCTECGATLPLARAALTTTAPPLTTPAPTPRSPRTPASPHP